jgi:hypothetical protein
MNPSPEVFAELFRQGAFIAAVAAGFSFAFTGAILTGSSKKRVAGWTAALSLIATAGLLLCALGWTLMTPRMLGLAQSRTAGGAFYPPGDVISIHRILSMLFIGCFFLFLGSLGFSGWIRSRTLGWVSSATAAAACAFAVWMLRFFIR